MKSLLLALALGPLAAVAEPTAGMPTTPSETAAPGMVLTTAAIAAHIAEAEAVVAGGQKYRGNPVLVQGPYSAKIEYHAGADKGVGANEDAAELFVVLEGSGTMTLGGTLVDAVRTGSHLQAASAVGGTPYRLSKGDVALIPASIAHTVSQTDGRLVLLSMHLPVPPPAVTPEHAGKPQS